MRLKVLASGRYRVLAVMDGDDCEVEEFLALGEASTAATRAAVIDMLCRAAELGLEHLPQKWTHEVNKKEKILQFIKGDIRVMFFKGRGLDIAVCVTGAIKKSQKADKYAVSRTITTQKQYWQALTENALEVMDHET